MRKFFCVFLTTLLVLLSLNSIAFASDDEISYDSLSYNIKESITLGEFNDLPYGLQQSILKYGIDSNSDNVESRATNGYLAGYSSFTTYVDLDFTQGGSYSGSSTTCVPISCANILSYFKYRGYSNLFSGSTISQSVFNQICTDVGWTSSNASTLGNAVSGLSTFASRKGYTITAYAVLTSGWNNLTNYITNNVPLIASETGAAAGKKGHAYTILGYRVNNGVREIYTQTGLDLLPYAWVEWSNISAARAFVIN